MNEQRGGSSWERNPPVSLPLPIASHPLPVLTLTSHFRPISRFGDFRHNRIMTWLDWRMRFDWKQTSSLRFASFSSLSLIFSSFPSSRSSDSAHFKFQHSNTKEKNQFATIKPQQLDGSMAYTRSRVYPPIGAASSMQSNGIFRQMSPAPSTSHRSWNRPRKSA